MTSIKPTELKGCITALITPMHKDGKVDKKKLEMLIEDQVANDCGILALGTTGQGPAFEIDEHVELTKEIYDIVGGRVPFMANGGSNNTLQAIKLSNMIEDAIGPCTLLHVTGYYNKPTQKGLILHYTAIAEKIDNESNVVVYNVPGRTNTNVLPETLQVLSQYPRIIGVKEASGDLKQVQEILETTSSEKFKVLSGEDGLVYDIMQLGGTGVVSATSNLGPKLMNDIVRAFNQGDTQTARFYQEKALPLIRAMFCKTNPIPLAHAFDTHLALPLCRDDEAEAEVREALTYYSQEILGLNIKKYQS